MLFCKCVALISALGFCLGLVACQKKDDPAESSSGAKEPVTVQEITLQGSGASFPAPLYGRWFKEFAAKNPGILVNYQATGSGAGVKAFTQGQADFGGSDAAMTDEEIRAVDGNVLLLPVTAGNIALVFNLKGVERLRLSREAYAGIFLGTITKWNDPKIAASNAGVNLPAEDVSVVRRSDGSGTTFVFTNHLAAINETWRARPGVGKSVEWPVGIGAPRNDGVTGLVLRTPGSVGYVEYAFAASSKQPTAELENKAGKFVAPSLEASQAALASVELPADFRGWAPDPAGADAYPIVTYTWILARKKYDDPAKGAAMKKLLAWCLTEGQKLSASLNYVPLPESVRTKVLEAVNAIQ